jgi:membrane-bound ClpP family serine protease
LILGAILLLAAAMVFVAAELFVPSHGMLTVFAALFALGSVIMAYRFSPSMGIIFGILVLAASPVVLFYAIRIYPKTPMGRRVLLNTPAAETSFAGESAKLQELVGQRGVTLTFLRPAGSVNFNGKRVDCLAESEMIPADTAVEVIRVSGMKVIVKAVAV